MEAMKQNMAWDGLFHAGVWVITVVGVYLLLAEARSGKPLPSASALTGQMIFGWGIFNLIEGLIDHHLLNIHHVRDMPAHVPMYDWAFLLVGGLGFIILGLIVGREKTSAPAGSNRPAR